jgi:acetolactate synthase-1/2/3 large subunit
MNGAESLLRSLVASDVEVCFANPGTSEMHFVAALDKVDGLRSILVLFEGVGLGASRSPGGCVSFSQLEISSLSQRENSRSG